MDVSFDQAMLKLWPLVACNSGFDNNKIVENMKMVECSGRMNKNFVKPISYGGGSTVAGIATLAMMESTAAGIATLAVMESTAVGTAALAVVESAAAGTAALAMVDSAVVGSTGRRYSRSRRVSLPPRASRISYLLPT